MKRRKIEAEKERERERERDIFLADNISPSVEFPALLDNILG